MVLSTATRLYNDSFILMQFSTIGGGVVRNEQIKTPNFDTLAKVLTNYHTGDYKLANLFGAEPVVYNGI